MAVEIRTVEQDELPRWLASMRAGYHQPEPPQAETAGRAAHFALDTDFSRLHGAFDGGRVVATFRSYGTELTVPGGAVRADAVTNVTVAPSHRRRGLLSSLMHADLAAAAERGEAVAILVASEWPIYGRYGFGPAAEIVEYEIDTTAAVFVQRGDGDMTVAGAADVRAAAPAIYDAYRRITPGAIERSGAWWDRRLGLVGFDDDALRHFALARDERGGPTGLVAYDTEGHWDQWRPRGTVTVGELFGTTPEATARLWRFACEVDLATRVVADQRAVDEPLPWLLRDARAVRQRYRTDFQWVRVLDVPAAFAARRYACADALVLEIDDPLQHAAGRFRLEGSPDSARCEPTDAPPDLALRVEALGAAYLGGASLHALAAAGWIHERTPGALARADAMLGWAIRPWNATLF